MHIYIYVYVYICEKVCVCICARLCIYIHSVCVNCAKLTKRSAADKEICGNVGSPHIDIYWIHTHTHTHTHTCIIIYIYIESYIK